MDFWTAVTILARRWLVLVVGVLVTSGAVVGVVKAVPPTYEVEGELILLLPAQKGAPATDIGRQNPYLGFGGSLNVMSSVVARAFGGQDAALRLAESAGAEASDATFVVDTVPGDAPMLSILTASENPAEAMAMYDRVQTAVLAELERRQADAGAPESLRIIADPVRTPVAPVRVTRSLLRAAAAVVVLGGAATLVSAFLVESIAVRRRGSGHGGRRPARPGAVADRTPVPADRERPGDREPVGRRTSPGDVEVVEPSRAHHVGAGPASVIARRE